MGCQHTHIYYHAHICGFARFVECTDVYAVCDWRHNLMIDFRQNAWRFSHGAEELVDPMGIRVCETEVEQQAHITATMKSVAVNNRAPPQATAVPAGFHVASLPSIFGRPLPLTMVSRAARVEEAGPGRAG